MIFVHIKVHNNNFGSPFRLPAVSRNRTRVILATLVNLFSFSPSAAASTRVLSEESDCDERGEFHPVVRSNEDRTGAAYGNNTVCH